MDKELLRRLEKLLDREKYTYKDREFKAYEDFFREKIVFITGAGGTIGSRLSAEIAKFPVKKLILTGQGEYSLFQLRKSLESMSYNFQNIDFILCDTKNIELLDYLFQKEKIDIVIHLAAFKHVSLMEDMKYQAIMNNIYGTLNVLDICKKWNVQDMVLVSSDKAVYPINVYGYTKRICEKLTIEFKDKYNLNNKIVRLFNVLGSRGSVIPIFIKQINENGMIKITDMQMRRFFMFEEEAIFLILESLKCPKKTDVCCINSLKEVKIMDIAKELIELSEKSVMMKEIGIMKGEKLSEQFYDHSEELIYSKNDKYIYIMKNKNKIKENYIKEISSYRDEWIKMKNYEIQEKLISFS